jgi:hypothetical protein
MIDAKMRVVLGAVVACGFAVAIATNAVAENRWQQHHPWRVQVNHRLGNLNRRIHQERREGELTRGQAMAEHREVHQIREEERGMARLNGTHLTRAEHRSLNQQENTVGGQLGK